MVFSKDGEFCCAKWTQSSGKTKEAQKRMGMREQANLHRQWNIQEMETPESQIITSKRWRCKMPSFGSCTDPEWGKKPGAKVWKVSGK